VVVEIGLPGAADVAQVEAPAGVETLPLARNGGLQARGGVGHAGEQGKRHEGACRQACQGGKSSSCTKASLWRRRPCGRNDEIHRHGT
jgi:hypothetical protein